MYYGVKKIETISELKEIFPDANAVNDMNFVVFSTSGIHGSYITIEQIERELLSVYPIGEEDKVGDTLTVLAIQPRRVALVYGDIQVSIEDIPYLKELRKRSREIFSAI